MIYLYIRINSIIANYADNTAILATHEDNLNKMQSWLKKWSIKENEDKVSSSHFHYEKDTCPTIQLNNQQLNQTEEAKYLIHMDMRLTWRKHTFV